MFSKNGKGEFGGAEVKMFLLSNELLSMNYEIFYITNQFIGKYEGKKINWFHKGLKPGKNNFKRFRFIINTFQSWRAFKLVNSDIYFQRAPGSITGILAFFCKIKKKRFYYMVASSQDVDGSYINSNPFKNRILYKYGLKNATAIFVQTENFKKRLHDNYKIQSHFIRDGINIPNSIKPYSKKTYITFIGGIRPVKNPEIFIKLAHEFPNNEFILIGGPLKNQNKYYSIIKKLAESEKNLIFTGHLEREQVHYYLSRSLLLINTSEREGLPNVVTEAWSYGVPVIGYKINPDNLLNGNLGYYCKGNYKMLIKTIKNLIDDKNIDKYNKISSDCVDYVNKNHNINNIATIINSFITKDFSNNFS